MCTFRLFLLFSRACFFGFARSQMCVYMLRVGSQNPTNPWLYVLAPLSLQEAIEAFKLQGVDLAGVRKSVAGVKMRVRCLTLGGRCNLGGSFSEGALLCGNHPWCFTTICVSLIANAFFLSNQGLADARNCAFWERFARWRQL